MVKLPIDKNSGRYVCGRPVNYITLKAICQVFFEKIFAQKIALNLVRFYIFFLFLFQPLRHSRQLQSGHFSQIHQFPFSATFRGFYPRIVKYYILIGGVSKCSENFHLSAKYDFLLACNCDCVRIVCGQGRLSCLFSKCGFRLCHCMCLHK